LPSSVALGDSVKAVPGGSGLLLLGAGVVLVGIAALTRPDPREGLAMLAATTFGAIYLGLLGYVERLASAGPPIDPAAALGWIGSQRAWVLILVLGVWAFDTSAYLVGRRFGRRRFIPHISPGKTVEGVMGGTVAAIRRDHDPRRAHRPAGRPRSRSRSRHRRRGPGR